jgi:hypothetical protein
MKRFIISVLCVSVFFIGLGGLVEKTTANFKSDARALEIIRRARVAIGGDASIANVRSLSITGKATKTLDFDGVSRTEQGDLEINLELPNKLSKMIKIGNADGGESVEKNIDVITVGKGEIDKNIVVTPEVANGEKRVFVFKKDDGEKMVPSGDGANGEPHKIIVNKDVRVAGQGEPLRQNQLFRTTLSLLLSAPEGLDVAYIYAGEATVDGSSCDVVEAQSSGDSIKLFLDKSTNLPRMMSFQAAQPMIFRINKDEATNGAAKVLVRKAEASEMAEFQVKFSDYRSVNGLQLPHKWTQTIAGKEDETVDITNYEVNPPNIAGKFDKMPTKVMIRTAKPQ